MTVDPFRQFLAITRFEMRRVMISWRVLFAFVCMVIICGFSFNAGNLDSSGKSGIQACYAMLRPFLASAPMMIAICAAVLASESLSEEFERRTGYIIFTRSLDRNVLFIGKYMSRLIPAVAILFLYYAVVFGICYAEVGELPGEVFNVLPVALLYLAAVIGICMLISSLSPRGSIALAVSFILLVVLPLLIDNVVFVTEPWYSLAYESRVLGDFLTNQTIFSMDSVGNIITSDYVPDVRIASSVMAVYAILSTLFAASFFRYRSM